MENYNKDEYGSYVYVNFYEDISAATSYTMILQPQWGGDTVEVVPVVGTGTVTVGDTVLTANQYVRYQITAGIFGDNSGLWRKKATAEMSPTVTKVTNYTFFRVLP